ncbi:MAG: J domain-containing protein [Acidobacteriia bacterium]|nr:J domain-containing protein [Terriglobia bacterium]
MSAYTHYEVLGIPRGSSDIEIKQAFRELARKYHPDMMPGMEGTRFRAIVQAYRILSNHRKRREYDREISNTATQFIMQ